MFFLWFILILIVIVILFVTSTIEIELKKLEINIPKIRNKIINQNFEVRLKFYLLKRIKIIDLGVDKTKMEKAKLRNQLTKLQSKLEQDKNNFDLEFFKIVKCVNVNIKEMNLKVYMGVEDVALTAILVGIISGILGILLKNKIKNLEKQKYVVTPIYQSKNILNLEISGIFAINMWNIINIIFKIIEKRRVKKDGRTSNRRTYAYSNE